MWTVKEMKNKEYLGICMSLERHLFCASIKADSTSMFSYILKLKCKDVGKY
jgi:hypothetical protein